MIEPGDEVLLFDPAYETYGACVTLAGGIPVSLIPNSAFFWAIHLNENFHTVFICPVFKLILCSVCHNEIVCNNFFKPLWYWISESSFLFISIHICYSLTTHSVYFGFGWYVRICNGKQLPRGGGWWVCVFSCGLLIYNLSLFCWCSRYTYRCNLLSGGYGKKIWKSLSRRRLKQSSLIGTEKYSYC